MESKRRRVGRAEWRNEEEGEYDDKKKGPAEPNWDELPPDLWRCILMLLNPEQVMQCRHASKWCRHVVDQLLLKDDFYLKERVWPSSPGVVVCAPLDSRRGNGVEIWYPWANNGEPGPRPLMTLKDFSPKYMAPSINGLICMISWANTIVLCNPTTGESLTLPVCPLPVIDPPYSGSDYSHYYEFGFGYSPSTDEYKFVHLGLRRRDRNRRLKLRFCECSVLTLRLSLSRPHDDRCQQRRLRGTDHDSSSSWRRIGHSFGHEYDDGFEVIDPESVCVDGVIYWSGYTSSPPDHDHYRYHYLGGRILFIVAFRVRDETFTTIPPPPTPASAIPHYVCRVTELQGRLGMGIIYRDDFAARVLDAWMLMGPGNWSRHLRIDLPTELGPHDYILRTSAFHFSCFSIDKFIVILKDYTGLIYDFKSKSLASQSGLPTPIGFKCSPIQESLLSLQFTTYVA